MMTYLCDKCHRGLDEQNILTDNDTTLSQAYCKNCGIVGYAIYEVTKIRDSDKDYYYQTEV